MVINNEIARAANAGDFHRKTTNSDTTNRSMSDSLLSRHDVDHLAALHALAWRRALAAGPQAARHLRLAEHLAAEIRARLATTAAARLRAHWPASLGGRAEGGRR